MKGFGMMFVMGFEMGVGVVGVVFVVDVVVERKLKGRDVVIMVDMEGERWGEGDFEEGMYEYFSLL